MAGIPPPVVVGGDSPLVTGERADCNGGFAILFTTLSKVTAGELNAELGVPARELWEKLPLVSPGSRGVLLSVGELTTAGDTTRGGNNGPGIVVALLGGPSGEARGVPSGEACGGPNGDSWTKLGGRGVSPACNCAPGGPNGLGAGKTIFGPPGGSPGGNELGATGRKAAGPLTAAPGGPEGPAKGGRGGLLSELTPFIPKLLKIVSS